jgi:hypothetical protein
MTQEAKPQILKKKCVLKKYSISFGILTVPLKIHQIFHNITLFTPLPEEKRRATLLLRICRECGCLKVEVVSVSSK